MPVKVSDPTQRFVDATVAMARLICKQTFDDPQAPICPDCAAVGMNLVKAAISSAQDPDGLFVNVLDMDPLEVAVGVAVATGKDPNKVRGVLQEAVAVHRAQRSN